MPIQTYICNCTSPLCESMYLHLCFCISQWALSVKIGNVNAVSFSVSKLVKSCRIENLIAICPFAIEILHHHAMIDLKIKYFCILEDVGMSLWWWEQILLS